MPIRPDLPPEPEFGAPLDPIHPSPDTLNLLALRRSTPVAALAEPGIALLDHVRGSCGEVYGLHGLQGGGGLLQGIAAAATAATPAHSN